MLGRDANELGAVTIALGMDVRSTMLNRAVEQSLQGNLHRVRARARESGPDDLQLIVFLRLGF